MISALLSRMVILVFGTLYPAYSSYKAVKTKDIKLYVKWMMYWIVFALFITAETFTDIFLGFWFPFYYEMKIILVIWLLSPVTRGSSIMYRKVIHPLLMRREQEIDELLVKAKEQGYHVILDMGCKGMNLATNAILNTAAKSGTRLLYHLKKSYSLDDLTNAVVVDKVNEERETFVSSKSPENRHDWMKCGHECEFVTRDGNRNTYRLKTSSGLCNGVSSLSHDSFVENGSTFRNQNQFVATFFQDVDVRETGLQNPGLATINDAFEDNYRLLSKLLPKKLVNRCFNRYSVLRLTKQKRSDKRRSRKCINNIRTTKKNFF